MENRLQKSQALMYAHFDERLQRVTVTMEDDRRRPLSEGSSHLRRSSHLMQEI